MTDFDDLVQLRARVREFTRAHTPSVTRFYDEEHLNFKVALDEDPPGDSDKKVSHLTSTLTCLESLFDYNTDGPGEENKELDRFRRDTLEQFASNALDHPEDWRSDKAAQIYCRVRTIGALLRLPPLDLEDTQRDTLRELVHEAWLSHDDSPAFGLREAAYLFRGEGAVGSSDGLTGRASKKTYPANAFLTYWGLLALDHLPPGLELDEQDELKGRALEWLSRTLAQQVSFHFAQSEHADPQQLAWSLCALVRFSGPELASKTSVAHTQLRAGLQAFFAQQHDTRGTWDKGQPLFHYPSVGNAYCYTYETLGELVGLATRRDSVRRDVLQDALYPYVSNLRAAFDAAVHSKQPLDEDELEGQAWGWSSGHHVHRTSAESWATASVFRFAQGLRRLVGIWTCNEAKQRLMARRPSPSPTLERIGGSWSVDGSGAGVALAVALVNPIKRDAERRARVDRFLPDPDSPVVPQKVARAAILFGPPGTGKTSLANAVAKALDWDFVEVTPAQFLDQGVSLVSKRADEIFRYIMELDRCVVLLDEIDELVQERSTDAESVERFFTTTMLPRLAKLWDAGRIVYFANTNDISKVDKAIKRGQRFDGALLVLPPGFEAKRTELEASYGVVLAISENDVEAQLPPGGATPPEDARLGWFALLRWDQIGQFAEAIKQQDTDGDGRYGTAAVSKALVTLIAEIRRDWGVDREAGDEVPRAFYDLRNLQRALESSMHVVRVFGDASRLGGVAGDDFVDVASPAEAKALVAGLGFRLRPDGTVDLDASP